MSTVDLTVEVASIKFSNPLLLASGILGNTAGLILRLFREGNVGGVITKSFTKEPREGYATPVIAYTKSGLVNAMGLPNPGIEGMVELLRSLRGLDRPVIVSIAGSDERDFCELAQLAEEHGASAVELNLSCPHVAKRGLEIGQDPQYVSKIVNSVKSTLNIPVLVKIGLSDRLVEIAKAIEKSGADAISAINTIRAVVIDVYAKRPVLSNVYGGLSGPAIHPIAVRVVYDLYRTVSIPIIGIGGVMDWKDAIELILAGATAIGVGTAIALKGIEVFREILRGIEGYLKEEGFKSIREVIGYAHKA